MSDQKHTQTPFVALQQSHDYLPASMNTVDGTTVKDSGLGITTDENYFERYDSHPGAEAAQFVNFETSTCLADQPTVPKLSSPFDDQSYTPATSWDDTYACSTTAMGESTKYAQPLDPTRYDSQDGIYPSHIAISPATFRPYSSTPSYPQQNQFRRPVHQNDASFSAGPQTGFFQYNTPITDASMFQVTPQSVKSEWQEHTPYMHNGTQLPSVMLDRSACGSSDFSPPFVRPQGPVRTIVTVPPRRKPHLRPSLSESCVPRMVSPARMRTASMGQFLQAPTHDQYLVNPYPQQLPLPTMPPSVLVNALHLPNQPSIKAESPYQGHRQVRSSTSTPRQRKRPSSPPASDFTHQNIHYLAPIKQEPTFAGDLYTPRYKRRTLNGRWEGWCGYCTPGRWLDLKNSRYWEDKLRNHGICAKTKVRFEVPVQIRWVGSDGSVIPENGISPENGDPFLDHRKREGLCGECHIWVGMDGQRTKARDRAVGWWMHAYKCHKHEEKAEPQTAVT